jgi:hypothetical protein
MAPGTTEPPPTLELFQESLRVRLRQQPQHDENPGPQRLADRLSNTLRHTSSLVLGTRRVVPGITMPWFTPRVATALQQRRQSLLTLRKAEIGHAKTNTAGVDAADESAQRLQEARNRYNAAKRWAGQMVKHAKREHTRRKAASLNAACSSRPGAKSTHDLLKATLPPLKQHMDIAEIQHPTTQEMCTEAEDILQGFATHFHALATPDYTEDPILLEERAQAKEKAQALFDSGD